MNTLCPAREIISLQISAAHWRQIETLDPTQVDVAQKQRTAPRQRGRSRPIGCRFGTVCIAFKANSPVTGKSVVVGLLLEHLSQRRRKMAHSQHREAGMFLKNTHATDHRRRNALALNNSDHRFTTH